tara:strand:- start:636 stop:1133 length:498 start_codon:yes stop_codon:yes gene_type:complete
MAKKVGNVAKTANVGKAANAGKVTSTGTGTQSIFKNERQTVLTALVIIGIALVAVNFTNITGGAITEPSSLSVFQDGKRITVQVNYPIGKYGRPNNIVDMQIKKGSTREDQTTECDIDRGLVSRGSADCRREIAEFLISGSTWNSGDIVVFSVRGTDISRQHVIR